MIKWNTKTECKRDAIKKNYIDLNVNLYSPFYQIQCSNLSQKQPITFLQSSARETAQNSLISIDYQISTCLLDNNITVEQF